MSFRGRLILALTLLTLLTLGGAFAAVSVAVNGSQERQLDATLLAEAAEEARYAQSLRISDRPGPPINHVGPVPKYAVIYHDERVVEATPTFADRPPPGAALHTNGRPFNLWAGDTHLRAVTVAVPGQPGHRLLLATPRTDLDEDEAFLRRAMISVFIVAVAWSALITTTLVRRMTRAHERIATVARRVAAGDLDARVGVNPSDPETAQLAQDLDEMIQRIGALVTSQREFIAHAAHELRSPLTTLYGELQHALRRERDAESYRRAIMEALGSTKRLKSAAEDLLALARLAAGSDLPRVEAQPAEIVREALDLVAPQAAAHRIELRVQGAGASVSCRPPEIARIVRNLAENAIRHSAPGSAVQIALSSDETHTTVQVRDNGPGVPPEERERIFEPFYRGEREQTDHPDGVGLGLAIARGIARAHGGDVIIGADGPGAVFELRLPRAD